MNTDRNTDEWFADLADTVARRDALHARATVLADRVAWTREWVRQSIAYAGCGMARGDVMRAELAFQDARALYRDTLAALAQAEDAIAWMFADDTMVAAAAVDATVANEIVTVAVTDAVTVVVTAVAPTVTPRATEVGDACVTTNAKAPRTRRSARSTRVLCVPTRSRMPRARWLSDSTGTTSFAAESRRYPRISARRSVGRGYSSREHSTAGDSRWVRDGPWHSVCSGLVTNGGCDGGT